MTKYEERSKTAGLICAFILGLAALYAQGSCYPANAQELSQARATMSPSPGTYIGPVRKCHVGITVKAVIVYPDGSEALALLGDNIRIPCHLKGGLRAVIADQPHEVEIGPDGQSGLSRADEAAEKDAAPVNRRPGERSSVRLVLVVSQDHIRVDSGTPEPPNPLRKWEEDPPK